MIQARALTLILTIILVVTVGGWPAAAKDSPRFSVAQAQSELQSKLHTLIDRLRGADMPDGIVKTNGRIEATQVDVAAKYPGRLASATVQGRRRGHGRTGGRAASRRRNTKLSCAARRHRCSRRSRLWQKRTR